MPKHTDTVEQVRADELAPGDCVWCGEGWDTIETIEPGEREMLSGRMKPAIYLAGDGWGIEPVLPETPFLRKL